MVEQVNGLNCLRVNIKDDTRIRDFYFTVQRIIADVATSDSLDFQLEYLSVWGTDGAQENQVTIRYNQSHWVSKVMVSPPEAWGGPIKAGRLAVLYEVLFLKEQLFDAQLEDWKEALLTQ